MLLSFSIRLKNASKGSGGRATPDINLMNDMEATRNNTNNTHDNSNTTSNTNNSNNNRNSSSSHSSSKNGASVGMKIGGIPAEINVSSQSGTDPECADSATSATSADGDCLLQTLTAAAESMKPSPSNRGGTGFPRSGAGVGGDSIGSEGGGGGLGSMSAPPSSSKKSGKARSRSYNGVVSDTTLQFPPHTGSTMDVDHEHSNFSYDTNSSGGNSNSNSNIINNNNNNSVSVFGNRLAPPSLLPSYNTPAMVIALPFSNLFSYVLFS